MRQPAAMDYFQCPIPLPTPLEPIQCVTLALLLYALVRCFPEFVAQRALANEAERRIVKDARLC